uniref:Uncharacterized protein n=1 Tax=Anguilla anguilla TaxID=7936 RepID=A0A0E9Q509_ANGAN
MKITAIITAAVTSMVMPILSTQGCSGFESLWLICSHPRQKSFSPSCR